MPNYPCKGCQDRYPACHDHCEKYKEIKALELKRKNAERGKQEADTYTIMNTMKVRDYNEKKKRVGRFTYSKKG